ncbi:MAG TPA: flagellar hook-basal body complex protein [Pirellulales bacterium]|nr:flagellar hook-basal body complex protein [Pirellulales bacterium]
MVPSRCLLVVGLACLVSGCSDARTAAPRRLKSHALQTGKAKPINGAANPGRPTGQVVKAAHVEVASELSPTAVAPELLDQASAADSREGDWTDHQQAADREASEVLTEAIKALRTKLTVLGHNMANADTIGFKRSRVTLEDCGYQHHKLPGAQDAFNNYSPVSIAVGHGCRVQSVDIDFSQGTLKETGRALDVAIEGEGFLQVIDPSTNNFLYTRTGNFAVNSNGVLVLGSASTGRVVQPQLTIPIDTMGVVISAEGNVSIQQFGQTQFSQIGQLQLAKFLNPQGLLKLGENLYQETLSSGACIFGQPGTNGLGTLRQKALERSNVDFDEELQAWQDTQRTLKRLERMLAAPVR